jgi:hypothetical protein
MPLDYALSSGSQIEVIRVQARGTPSDHIEFTRTKPLSTGEPQVVSAGFDWSDAAVGADVVLTLILLGGGGPLATRQLGCEQTA